MIYNSVIRIRKELRIVGIDAASILSPFVKVVADEFRQRFKLRNCVEPFLRIINRLIHRRWIPLLLNGARWSREENVRQFLPFFVRERTHFQSWQSVDDTQGDDVSFGSQDTLFSVGKE